MECDTQKGRNTRQVSYLLRVGELFELRWRLSATLAILVVAVALVAAVVVLVALAIALVVFAIAAVIILILRPNRVRQLVHRQEREQRHQVRLHARPRV